MPNLIILVRGRSPHDSVCRVTRVHQQAQTKHRKSEAMVRKECEKRKSASDFGAIEPEDEIKKFHLPNWASSSLGHVTGWQWLLAKMRCKSIVN